MQAQLILNFVTIYAPGETVLQILKSSVVSMSGGPLITEVGEWQLQHSEYSFLRRVQACMRWLTIDVSVANLANIDFYLSRLRA